MILEIMAEPAKGRFEGMTSYSVAALILKDYTQHVLSDFSLLTQDTLYVYSEYIFYNISKFFQSFALLEFDSLGRH